MLTKFHLREIAIFLPVFLPFLILANCNKEEALDYEKARRRMVENQLKARGVKDKKVLEAMGKVPRHLFVPEDIRHLAYADRPLPIGEGQTISQPYIVALMTECLSLKGNEKVLEIGTGSGYQAAVLAELVDSIFTIEIIEDLAMRARKTLSKVGYTNVFVKVGDGYFGWPEHAPFDGIIVTCAPESIPQPLIDQLSEGGRMVIPVGDYYQMLKLILKENGRLIEKEIIPVLFVPMKGEIRKGD